MQSASADALLLLFTWLVVMWKEVLVESLKLRVLLLDLWILQASDGPSRKRTSVQVSIYHSRDRSHHHGKILLRRSVSKVRQLPLCSASCTVDTQLVDYCDDLDLGGRAYFVALNDAIPVGK